MHINDTTIKYAANHSSEHPVLSKLRKFNERHEKGYFQTSRTQAAFLAFLVELTQATKIIEVGVFTGYTSTAMALAMPQRGSTLVAIDKNQEYLNIAEDVWEEAEVGGHIVSICGDAVEVLTNMHTPPKFDMIYIDIEQMDLMPEIYKQCKRLLHIGGLLAIDNVFWAGEVSNKSIDPFVISIQQFNEHVLNDEQMHSVMLPGLGDGLLLATKTA